MRLGTYLFGVLFVMLGGSALQAQSSPMSAAKKEAASSFYQIEKVQSCAGEWSRGVATLADGRRGVVAPHRFSDSASLWSAANVCWPNNVVSTDFFQEGVRLVCAPYIRCN